MVIRNRESGVRKLGNHGVRELGNQGINQPAVMSQELDVDVVCEREKGRGGDVVSGILHSGALLLRLFVCLSGGSEASRHVCIFLLKILG